jgi:phosphotransferase system enzyme I (PtsI)
MSVTQAEKQFNGLGVSEGIRIGKAFVYQPLKLEAIEESKSDDVERELKRLELAKEHCLAELGALVEKTTDSLGEEKAGILKGQISFLNDPSFYPPMRKLVEGEGWTAETAAKRTVAQVAGLFEAMANEYMRERAADIRDVGARLISHIVGHQGARLEDIREQVIIVADDLTPSDTVQLDKQYVLGFVTSMGGKTSHTAILANSLGIAAVLGAGEAVDDIPHGAELVIDGSTGRCVLHPNASTKAEFEGRSLAENEEQERLRSLAGLPAVTLDGVTVELAANIGTPQEAAGLLAKGAEAVGLYRTEFLFMETGAMPSEEEQYRAYREAAEAMQGHAVVIRTLDIGGDKELPYLDLPKEMNPFLGYRAIRLCLDRRELLLTQLRAMIRAGAHGTVKIMFPMISGMEEWRAAKELYEEARTQLAAEGAAIPAFMEVGVMIEVPSAALLADRLAREVDFFSIGTNDLVQYTVAVDRMNEKVAYLYDYFHPAVIGLIKTVIDAAARHGKWTGMCGSMAGDPLAAPLLLGLGLNEWSMASGALHRVKAAVRGLNQTQCKAFAEKLLELDTAAEIRQALTDFQQS